jgi:hypothetical protein
MLFHNSGLSPVFAASCISLLLIPPILPQFLNGQVQGPIHNSVQEVYGTVVLDLESSGNIDQSWETADYKSLRNQKNKN